MQPAPPVSTRRRPPSRVRRVMLLSLVAIFLLGGAGAGVLFYLRHQQDSHIGHWAVFARPAPGQPTPTVPSGAVVFKNVGGTPVLYFPPAEPPVPVTWQSYQDPQHGYRLELPGNWTQLDQSPTLSGARMVCPPGADTQDDAPGAPACVSYGWVPAFALPSASDPTVADLQSLTAGSVRGTLYTESALGTIITAVFPTEGGDVVITTFGNSDALMYAFQHMLASLTFS